MHIGVDLLGQVKGNVNVFSKEELLAEGHTVIVCQ